jgi:hypothetical protein
MGTKPFYIDMTQARAVLAEMGVELTERQIKRAAESDAEGRRKLPFFVDPIEGKLKIERQSLIDTYTQRQVSAQRNLKPR